jgi:diguanylate cyclase (GGDEF)-like protein/PAS domain S-box-containing protein
MLDHITAAVVDVLDFGAAAINVITGDTVTVASVVGPAEAQSLLGKTSPLAFWVDMLEAAEPWGELRFFSHERDQTIVDRIANWTPDRSSATGPDAWHPDDSLFAPLLSPQGEMVGVLSVDQPGSGRRPSVEQQTMLELFAMQAALAITDALARREAESKQRRNDDRWRSIFDNSPIATILGRPDGAVADANDAFLSLLGRDREWLSGLNEADFTHPEDAESDATRHAELLAGTRTRYEVEKRFLHADGHIVWVRLHIGAVEEPDDQGTDRPGMIVLQVVDVTQRKFVEQELAHRATHDPLTNLPNRAVLEDALSGWLAASRPTGVLFCDLDRFKIVNDSLGHDAGDELLVAVALRLRDALPSEVMLGRVGGDEFVALAPGQSEPEALRALGELMMSALRRPVQVRGHDHTLGLSVGITVGSFGHQHPDEILREADQALLRAKRRGRARVELYDPCLDHPATVDDLELERALRDALASGDGLIPYFQPIISLVDGRTVGYESLIRWQHPTLGLLDPADFLPLAEETGLIVPLGWLMLERSCVAFREVAESGASRWVAVNVSGSQLGRGQLARAVEQALAAGDLRPRELHLEITETALVDASPAAIGEVREVAAMGVQIALDDFGTGYSSLSLLRDLPVGTVKIDRSFVSPIAHDRSAIAIVRSVIGLCRELGITTIAEGVESESQLTTVRALGCDQAQGFFIGNPHPGLGGV